MNKRIAIVKSADNKTSENSLNDRYRSMNTEYGELTDIIKKQ